MNTLKTLILSFIVVCFGTQAFATSVDCSDQHLSQLSVQFGGKTLNREDFLKMVKKSVVTIKAYNKNALSHSCSGFMFKDTQHVMTNAHCLQSDTQLKAVFHDGTEISINQVVADAGWLDAAVVKLDRPNPNTQAIQFDAYSRLKKDEAVLTLPGCHVDFQEPQFYFGHSFGKVAYLNSTLSGTHGFTVNEYMQNNNGKSGSLMINKNGHPVGISEGTETNFLTLHNKSYDYNLAIGIQGNSIVSQLKYYPKALNLQPWRNQFINSTPGQAILTSLTINRGDLKDAEILLENVIANIKARRQDYPFNVLALAGELSEELGYPEDALVWYQLANQRLENNPFILFSMGFIKLQAGQTDPAIADLQKVLDFLPDHQPTLALLDYIYSNTPGLNSTLDYREQLSNARENQAFIENFWENLSH